MVHPDPDLSRLSMCEQRKDIILGAVSSDDKSFIVYFQG